MNTSNNQDGWYNLIYDYGAEVITEDHKGHHDRFAGRQGRYGNGP